MRGFLGKYSPPLSVSDVEEIVREHERLVAIEIEKEMEKVKAEQELKQSDPSLRLES